MSNYTKRIVNIETNFNEMYRDHKFTKKTFKDKINEVIGLCENLG